METKPSTTQPIRTAQGVFPPQFLLQEVVFREVDGIKVHKDYRHIFCAAVRNFSSLSFTAIKEIKGLHIIRRAPRALEITAAIDTRPEQIREAIALAFAKEYLAEEPAEFWNAILEKWEYERGEEAAADAAEDYATSW